MSSPQCVYIDRNSAPRLLFSGDTVIEVDLPVGTRVIYPKPPLEALPDLNAAIRYALNHPYGTEPLYAKLRPGMKVAIALDDISLPLPPMKRPDVRETILEILLEMLAQHGVEDIEMIIALAYHRRMKPEEIRRMVGDRVFDAYHPHRLRNFDAEDANDLVTIGETPAGVPVDLCRSAAEADLLIYVNINLSPLNGGFKSAGVGLCGGRTLNSHHDFRTMHRTECFMNPKRSALHEGIEAVGRVINEKVDLFHIETSFNNAMFDKSMAFLAKNPDDFTTFEKLGLRSLKFALDHAPEGLRHEVFTRYAAPYGVTGVFAGATEATHERTLEKVYEQYLVPVQGQCDIQITGIPYISPYNVGSFLNPLLVQVLAQGYFFNLHRGAPLLERGGTLIITHPLSDRFDHEQHGCYVEFVHRFLAETKEAYQLHKRFEREFARNPAYVEQYRRGHAFHPNHPFYMWYWGERGRAHQGRCIVVGADNEYIPQLLGYETAPNMTEAIRMARETAPPEPQITCANFAPILITDVTP